MNNIIGHKNEDDEVVFRIDKKKKTGKYFVVGNDRQDEVTKNPIRLEGFIKLPSGFYKDGYGLTSGGNLTLNCKEIIAVKKILYIDMDNVLVDFPSGIAQLDEVPLLGLSGPLTNQRSKVGKNHGYRKGGFNSQY